MKEFVKGKLVTGLIVVATIILAGVAIFTALRLYQLRRESVSLTGPESEPLAWDCKNYVFNVDANGVVSVKNTSSNDEPPQQAKVYINDSLVATFDVPALSQGQSATLGSVQVPSGSFNWKVVGTKDCQSSGSSSSKKACELLTFSLTEVSPTVTVTNSPSPTSTLTPTQTPTPTEVPRGGSSPTPTETPGPTSTNTPTPTTSGGISAVSPTPGGEALPQAGISLPTILTFGAGLLIIAAALLLAL